MESKEPEHQQDALPQTFETEEQNKIQANHKYLFITDKLKTYTPRMVQKVYSGYLPDQIKSLLNESLRKVTGMKSTSNADILNSVRESKSQKVMKITSGHCSG